MKTNSLEGIKWYVDKAAKGRAEPGICHSFMASLATAINYIEGNVISEAYALNVPLRGTRTTAHAGAFPAAHALLRLDRPHVVIEAVKKSEEGDDVIVRLYEATGCDCRTVLRLGFPVRRVAEVGLMEDRPRRLARKGDSVALAFGPFEIKTLRLDRRTGHFSEVDLLEE